jgi:hypothetical protein
MKRFWTTYFKSVCFLSLICLAQDLRAAACCGGGVAAPTIITGDDRAQAAISATHSQILTDVNASGIWRDRETTELGETLRIDAAYKAGESWQVGASVPVISRSRANDQSSGLGDVALNTAYEYLPELEYNPYRPKGLGYLQLIIPTGRTVFEDSTGIEARGRGYWALGLGTLLTKTIGDWDGLLVLDLHRSFRKSVHTSQFTGTLSPGFGGSVLVGGGYNLRSWRFGLNLAWFYEDPVQAESADSSTAGAFQQYTAGTLQRYASASAVVSYLASDEWSATLNIADQTLFGSPLNSSLGRSVSLMLAKRWPL